MHAPRFLVMIVALGALSFAFSASDAVAQKKKPAAPPPAAAEQKTPASQILAGKPGASLKDLLVRFKGELTTIGILKLVESDYIVVEDDGVEIIYPVSSIRSIKILKVEEENSEEKSPKLEIKLQ
jgi:hypothetical protein